MSQEERDGLDWLKRTRDGTVTQKFAAEQMGISDRWVRSLLAEMRAKGDVVVVHGLRGRPSNRRIGGEILARAMEIVKAPDWHDFKPSFAAEKLAELHQIEVSKETVRQWMMAEGIWKSKARKLREVHPLRPRRSHYGELVQWDTSDHGWLEGRGERVPHLVRMIDDATSRSWGPFVPRDGTRENMGVLWEYVVRFGRPVDYYTDRDSMFAVARQPGESQQQQRVEDRVTQIGRALRELGIGWIPAYSPQAKGRVERSFRTDQDRLIKELRLAKVTTMQAANDFLEQEYWPEWNAKFTQRARGLEDLHRPLAEGFELGSALSHVEHRIITNDYTFPYYGKHYQIARQDVQAGMRRQSLRLELWLDPLADEGFYRAMIEYFTCRTLLQDCKIVREGADVIEMGGNMATSGVGPKLFEKYVLEYENRVAKAVHAAGGFVIYHNCGDAAKIMHLYNSLDIDVWGYLTPPPFGDVNLDKALKVIKPDMVLRGNIDQVEFLVKASPAEIRERGIGKSKAPRQLDSIHHGFLL